MMKTFVLAFVIALFAFAGCKQEDIDPMDDYVGTYEYSAISTNVAGSGPLGHINSGSSSGSGKLIVQKDPKPNTLTFLFDGATRFHNVLLTGATNFTFIISETVIDSFKREFQRTTTGEGKITGSGISMTITQAAPAVGLNETTTIIGTRK